MGRRGPKRLKLTVEDVFDRIVLGATDREICAEFGVGRQTVARRVREGMAEAGVTSRPAWAYVVGMRRGRMSVLAEISAAAGPAR